MNAEQKQMTYRAAERVMAEHDSGRSVDPLRIVWARHWLAERDRCEGSKAAEPCPLCRADHTLSQCPRWTQRPQEVAR